LFSRRAVNVDGVLCMPVPNSDTSRIWLRVREGARLARVEGRLERLHDVHSVRRHPPDHTVFDHPEGAFNA
jgi:acetolactate synthase-1/3 small subunit